MRVSRFALLAALVVVVVCLSASTAAAAPKSGPVPPGPAQPPEWMTPEIRERISAAGPEGVHVSTIRDWVRLGLAGPAAQEEPVLIPCGNGDPRFGVNAGNCEVWPHGCTFNFIFNKGPEFSPVSDGRHQFIGTAGHCVDHANQPVFGEVGPGMVAEIGVVAKILAGDIGQNGFGQGGIGNDFTIIRIHPGRNINPGMPPPPVSGGGPHGIYTGCGPEAVRWWGHGFEAFVGPGKNEAGVATNWFERGFGWTGAALAGDSGSGVLIAGGPNNNQAAGDLTHSGLNSKYPGSTVFGTRVTRALTWMGGDYYLVNEDGSTSRATMADTRCEGANNGRRPSLTAR